jgi:hypothetical protein
MTEDEKREHDQAWWATYRAALTGIHAANEEISIDEAHDLAVMAADKAHGQRTDGAEI